MMPETSVQLGYPASAEILTTGGLDSVPAAFQRTVSRFGDAVAFRTGDDQIRLTWSQVAREVEHWSGSMFSLGVRHGETVALLLENRPEHLIADLAVLHLGGTPTSVYNSLAAEELGFVVGDARARVVVTQASLVGRVREAVTEHGLLLDVLVVLDDDDPDPVGDADVYSERTFLAREPIGDFDFEAAWRTVGREDIALVVYTSGTTGRPKGVEMSHRSALACAEVYREKVPVDPGRRLLSAFPLAHVAERVMTYYVAIVQGHCVTFCPSIRLLSDYYLRVRPAFVFMTPRSLERFRAVIEKTVALTSEAERRREMEEAIAVGMEVFMAKQRGEEPPEGMVDAWTKTAAIRKELLAVVGLDEVEYAGVGSAPVEIDLMAFFHSLGMPAREGWGMTETGATTAIGGIQETYRVGYCGAPAAGMEIRTADDGEILVRGPGLMSGYRNLPEATAQAFNDEGWFMTGDIGELNELGQLRMLDRKREIIINANGKNMSPVKIESKVKGAGSLIGQVVAVGDSKPHVTALILLDMEGLEVFKKRYDIPSDRPLGVLSKEPMLLAALQAQIDAANEQLSDVEKIRNWTLIADEWQPGGDELTLTMKMKRRVIRKKYADQIDELYL